MKIIYTYTDEAPAWPGAKGPVGTPLDNYPLEEDAPTAFIAAQFATGIEQGPDNRLRGRELRIEQQKRQSAEMIAVKMGDQNEVDVIPRNVDDYYQFLGGYDRLHASARELCVAALLEARAVAAGNAGRIRAGDVEHDPRGGECPSWCDLWPMCRVERA